jgi:hypothetical protein
LLLRATRTSEAKFSLDVSSAPVESSVSVISNAALEKFRTANPAARSLPLLLAFANRANESVMLENVNGMRLMLDIHAL